MIGCATNHRMPVTPCLPMVPAMISAPPEKSSSDFHHGRIHPRYSQWPAARNLKQKQRWRSQAKKKREFNCSNDFLTIMRYGHAISCDIVWFHVFHVIWCFIVLYHYDMTYDQQSSAWRSSHTHLRGWRDTLDISGLFEEGTPIAQS